MGSLSTSLVIDALDRNTGPVPLMTATAEKLITRLTQGQRAAAALNSTLAKIDGYQAQQQQFNQLVPRLTAAHRETAALKREVNNSRNQSQRLSDQFGQAETKTQALAQTYHTQQQALQRLKAAAASARQEATALQGRMAAGLGTTDDLVQRYQQAKQAATQMTQAVRQQRREVSAAKQAHQQSRTGLKSLAQQLATTDRHTAALGRKFEQAQRRSDSLRQSHTQQYQRLRSLSSQLRQAGVDTRNLSQAPAPQRSRAQQPTRPEAGSTALRRRVDNAGGRISRALQRNTQSPTLVTKLTGASEKVKTLSGKAQDLIAEPINQMRTVERSKSELVSLGLNSQQIEQVVAKGRELSKVWAGINTAAFVSAAHDIRSGIAALNDSEVASVTARMAETAKATQMSMQEMSSLFETGFELFKDAEYPDISNSDFSERFSASLTQSLQLFKKDGEQVKEAIQAMGSGLSAAGVSMAEQFVALGMLQNSMDAQDSGQAMSALADKADSAQQHFDQNGVNITLLDDNGNLNSLASLLEQMQSAYGHSYTPEVDASLQQAFGSQEAASVFKALWGQQATFRGHTQTFIQAQQQGGDYTRQVARRVDNNMDARLQVMSQRMDLIKEKIGYALIPVLERLLPHIEKFADWLTQVLDESPGLATTLAAVVAGIGMLGTALSTLISGVAGFVKLISSLGKLIARIPGVSTLFGRDTTNPDRPRPGPHSDRRDPDPGRRQSGVKGLLGRAGMIGATAVNGLSIVDTLSNDQLSKAEKTEQVAASLGALGGGMIGATIGAAALSFIPGVGTLVGGLVGGAIGASWGGALGERIGRGLNPDESADQAPAATATPAVEARLPQEPGSPLARELQAPTRILEPAQLDATPALAQAPTTHTHNNDIQIIVQQAPGEHAEALVQRLMDELASEQARTRRVALYDRY